MQRLGRGVLVDQTAVSRYVVTEVRTSVERAGLGAVPAADVWSTAGLQLVDMETGKGRFTARALLIQYLNAPQCYEFRARADPSSFTARHVPRQQCDSPQHSDPGMLISAARNAAREASAGKIEQRIRHAVADGRLTDAELAQALALPRTDGRGRPVPREPIGVLLEERRSATEAVVAANIEDWHHYHHPQVATSSEQTSHDGPSPACGQGMTASASPPHEPTVLDRKPSINSSHRESHLRQSRPAGSAVRHQIARPGRLGAPPRQASGGQ
jgi:hypothetical protein